jgi:hypothetical protein
MFAQIAVFADDDDYGAEAHSESMNIVEEDDYENGQYRQTYKLKNTKCFHIVLV